MLLLENRGLALADFVDVFAQKAVRLHKNRGTPDLVHKKCSRWLAPLVTPAVLPPLAAGGVGGGSYFENIFHVSCGKYHRVSNHF